jgi:hypothetical protein
VIGSRSRRRSGTAALLLALLAPTAQTEPLDGGLYSYDVATNLAWLDLSATSGWSYADVSSQLGPGGYFEGWSVATNEQVSGFFDAFGLEGPYDGDQLVLSLQLRFQWGAGDFLTQAVQDDGLRGGGAVDPYTVCVFGACVPFWSVYLLPPGSPGTPDTEARDDLSVALVREPIPRQPIHQIHGPGPISPFLGALVHVEGIVVAIEEGDPGAYFLKDPLSADTANLLDILRVVDPTVTAQLGDAIAVAGTVDEAPAPASPWYPLTTRLDAVLSRVVSTGNPLPLPLAGP